MDVAGYHRVSDSKLWLVNVTEWASVSVWVCVCVCGWINLIYYQLFDVQLTHYWISQTTQLPKHTHTYSRTLTHTLTHTHTHTYSPREWQFDFGIKLTVRSINKLNLFAGKTFLLKFMSLPHVVAMQTPILPLSHSPLSFLQRALQSSTHNKWNMFLRQLAAVKAIYFIS